MQARLQPVQAGPEVLHQARAILEDLVEVVRGLAEAAHRLEQLDQPAIEGRHQAGQCHDPFAGARHLLVHGLHPTTAAPPEANRAPPGAARRATV